MALMYKITTYDCYQNPCGPPLPYLCKDLVWSLPSLISSHYFLIDSYNFGAEYTSLNHYQSTLHLHQSIILDSPLHLSLSSYLNLLLYCSSWVIHWIILSCVFHFHFLPLLKDHFSHSTVRIQPVFRPITSISFPECATCSIIFPSLRDQLSLSSKCHLSHSSSNLPISEILLFKYLLNASVFLYLHHHTLVNIATNIHLVFYLTIKIVLCFPYPLVPHNTLNDFLQKTNLVRLLYVPSHDPQAISVLESTWISRNSGFFSSQFHTPSAMGHYTSFA